MDDNYGFDFRFPGGPRRNRYKVLAPMFESHKGFFWTALLKEMDASPHHYVPIKPVFNRDGWYYDRLTGACWHEQRGRAWKTKGDAEQFRYELGLHDTRRLSPKERSAIRTLIRMGHCPKTLSEHLRKEEEVEGLRRIRRHRGMNQYDVLHRAYRTVEASTRR